MKNIEIITELEKYLETGNHAILTQLLDGLNKEYKLEELKKSSGASAVKRQKAIEKLLKKNQKTMPNKNFDKLFIDTVRGEEKQFLFGLYYLIALNKDYFVTAPTNSSEAEKPNFQKLMSLTRYSYKEVDFDIAEIKKSLAKWKAEQKEKPKKDRTEHCVLPIGNIEKVGFNAEYFIEIYGILNGANDVRFYQNLNAYGVSYFESEVGMALLCPCKR